MPLCGQPDVAAVAAALVLIVLALVLTWRPLVAAWHGWRQRLQGSEAFARKALIKEAQAGDPAATYRARGVWLERLTPAERGRVRADAHLAPLVAALERSLFGGGGGWERENGEDLARAVRAFPRQAGAPSAARAPLPPLNPACPA